MPFAFTPPPQAQLEGEINGSPLQGWSRTKLDAVGRFRLYAFHL